MAKIWQNDFIVTRWLVSFESSGPVKNVLNHYNEQSTTKSDHDFKSTLQSSIWQNL
jgi:hypothetical protein